MHQHLSSSRHGWQTLTSVDEIPSKEKMPAKRWQTQVYQYLLFFQEERRNNWYTAAFVRPNSLHSSASTLSTLSTLLHVPFSYSHNKPHHLYQSSPSAYGHIFLQISTKALILPCLTSWLAFQPFVPLPQKAERAWWTDVETSWRLFRSDFTRWVKPPDCWVCIVAPSIPISTFLNGLYLSYDYRRATDFRFKIPTWSPSNQPDCPRKGASANEPLNYHLTYYLWYSGLPCPWRIRQAAIVFTQKSSKTNRACSVTPLRPMQ